MALDTKQYNIQNSCSMIEFLSKSTLFNVLGRLICGKSKPKSKQHKSITLYVGSIVTNETGHKKSCHQARIQKVAGSLKFWK